jgi:transposase-like protein
MSGHGEKLTHKQERAIAALLVAPSVTAAAQQIGVNENTLLRWLKDTAFERAYKEARRAVVQQAIVRMQQLCSKVVTKLEELIDDPDAPASSRVTAMKTVLEMSWKAIELEDLEARIAALEAHGAPR